MKNGRLYIYGSLALIILVFNFIYELENTNAYEALTESAFILPVTVVFIWFVQKLRRVLLDNSRFSMGLTERKVKNKIWTVAIVLVSIFFWTVVVRYLGNLLLDDDDSALFDLLFVTVFVSGLVITLFIFFFERFLEVLDNRYRMEIQLSQYENEKLISKYLSLKEQLNPHFLFNSFNSLMSLITINPTGAEQFVEELAAIYRYNLSKSEDLVVSLKEELEMINSYVHLQKIRFGESLVYLETVGPTHKNLMLPPMTLQLLIENAVKHNKVSRDAPLTIRIFIEKASVIVENNFQPRENYGNGASSFGIGQSSLNSQLKVITDKSLQIENSNGNYKLTVPLINREVYD